MRQLKRQLRTVRRIQCLSGCLALIAAAVLVVVFYRPTARQLSDLQQKRLEADVQLRTGLTHTSILPAVAADVERLKAELGRSKTLPHQKELPQFIGDIAQLAGQCQLGKFDLKPGMPTHEDQYNLLPMTLNFEGDFMNAFSFIRKTEQLAQLTRVKTLQIDHKDKSGQVKVQLTLLIYFGVEQT